MATAKSLEDMLTSEVDESAVNALVGSLESQLASTNVNASSQDVATTSATVNHVNSSPLVDGSVMQVLDGQKHGQNAGNQPSVIGKNSGSVAQVVDGQPVSSAASSVMVTLPGALPASGYITQVTGPAQQTFFAPAGTIAVNRALAPSNQDIKIVYTTQSAVAPSNGTNAVLRNNLQASIPNGSPTPVTMIALRPGQSLATIPAVSAAVSTPSTSMSAMHDLANIASQQTPIVIPSTCNAVGTTVASTTTQSKTVNKPVTRMQLRERAAATADKATDKAGSKVGVTTRSQEAAANTTAPPPASTTTPVNVVATTISKAPAQASHHVNVVSQVVTNPSILPPGVQIINVNPRLSAQGLAGAKTLAPRVVLSNPLRIATAPQIMTTTRPGVAGQRCMQPNNVQLKADSSYRQMHVTRAQLSSPKFIPVPQNKNTITLQPGVMRGAIIVKTDNGPLQVVNLGSASGGAIPGGTTYRLQSIQGPGTPTVRTMSPQQMTVTVPVSGAAVKGSSATVSGTQTIVGTILQQGSTLNAARIAGPNITSQTHQAVAVKVGVNGNIATPLTIQTTTNNQTPSAPSQMSPNTAKKKCKNFLSTLIRLADEQPPSVAKSVRSLIQGIIDGTIQAEEFTAKLQKELNSAPQPYLVPFLKKNLPFLRHSLITKELTIEGVRPPPPGALSLPHPQLGTGQQPQQQMGLKKPAQPTAQMRLATSTPVTLAARLLQTNQNALVAQRFAGPRLPGVSTNQARSVLANNMLIKTSAAAASPATVGALQAKSPAFLKGSPILTLKDKGKNSFSALRDDDDINDVAAMGGVNLVEESQKILASNSELVGTQIRSCKDESCFVSGAFQRRLHAIALKHGLEDVSPEVTALVAFAAQERLKTMLEKLAVIAEHRVENARGDSRYEVTQDVKLQIKFLEELDRLERRRHEEQEREILLRAAKSRSKLEDPEQLKLKQKAKEMQRAELEEMRQREANTTALLAIGPRKKMKLDSAMSNQVGSSSVSGLNSTMPKALPRPRVKRVNLRDLLYLMEQERETVRTPLLYKSYFK